MQDVDGDHADDDDEIGDVGGVDAGTWGVILETMFKVGVSIRNAPKVFEDWMKSFMEWGE